MTDKERIVELAKAYICPNATPSTPYEIGAVRQYTCFALYVIGQLGYTRQPEPDSVDIALEKQHKEWVREQELKSQSLPESAQDKFWQAIKDAKAGKPLALSEDELELFSAIQNLGIEQASPAPELTLIESNPYYLQDSDGDHYNKYPEFQVYQDGKQAQLEHDRGGK